MPSSPRRGRGGRFAEARVPPPPRRAPQLALNAAALLALAPQLEPVWGSREFLKFVVLVNACAGACSFVYLFLDYVATCCHEHSERELYWPFSGFQGAIGALLVGLKQQAPPEPWQVAGCVPVHGALLPLYATLALCLAGTQSDAAADLLPFWCFGSASGWVYLRYFQKREGAILAGDQREEFDFASFFPEVLRPFITKVTGPLHSMASRCCGGRGAEFSAQPLATSAPLPGSTLPEARRRRERGARALEDRLRQKRAAAAAEAGAASADGAGGDVDVEAPAPSEPAPEDAAGPEPEEEEG